MKRILILLCVVILLASCFVCSAQVYSSDVPSYCPVAGGAWIAVTTSQGSSVLCFSSDYISNCFGFAARTGYDLLNTRSVTVNGTVYFQNATSFYGNPTQLSVRFASMSGLEVYEPYRTGTGGTSYRWTPLTVTSVTGTNVALEDTVADRQNNVYIYSVSEKLQIITICLIIAILLYFFLGRAWHA